MKRLIFLALYIVISSQAMAQFNSYFLLGGDIFEPKDGDKTIYETMAYISKDKVRFYRSPFLDQDSQWEYAPAADFIIPEKSDYVFGMGHNIDVGIGVVKENTIRFFSYDDADRKWSKAMKEEFRLPSGYDAIIANNSCIGIVNKNEIKFYDYDYITATWSEVPKMAFVLPDGCSNVVFNGFNISFILDNKVYYYSHNEEWKQRPSVFDLPPGAKGIIPYGSLIMYPTAVVFENYIQTYFYVNQNLEWVNHQSAFFDMSIINGDNLLSRELSLDIELLKYRLLPCEFNKALSMVEFYRKLNKYYYIDIYDFEFPDGWGESFRRLYSGFSYGTIQMETSASTIYFVMYSNTSTSKYVMIQFADFYLGNSPISGTDVKTLFRNTLWSVDDKI